MRSSPRNILCRFSAGLLNVLGIQNPRKNPSSSISGLRPLGSETLTRFLPPPFLVWNSYFPWFHFTDRCSRCCDRPSQMNFPSISVNFCDLIWTVENRLAAGSIAMAAANTNSEESPSFDELYDINLFPSELFLKFRKEMQGLRVGLNLEVSLHARK